MDTTSLQDFINIVEYGSVAEVARRTGVTPAAINQRVKKMEQELGIRVLMRSGHTVKPTKQGLLILAHAKEILRKISDLKSIGESDSISGQLNIGAFDSAMTGIVPKVIQEMCQDHPSVEFMLVNGYSVNLYRKVFDGDLDVAIVVEPVFEIPKNFEWLKIREEPLIVLSSTCYPERDPNTLLQKYPMIGYDRTLAGGQLAELYLRQSNISPKIRCELASVETIALLVSLGLGVAIVPDWASSTRASSSLIKLEITGAFAKSRSIGILWNTQSVRLATIRRFLKIVQNVCARL